MSADLVGESKHKAKAHPHGHTGGDDCLLQNRTDRFEEHERTLVAGIVISSSIFLYASTTATTSPNASVAKYASTNVQNKSGFIVAASSRRVESAISE